MLYSITAGLLLLFPAFCCCLAIQKFYLSRSQAHLRAQAEEEEEEGRKRASQVSASATYVIAFAATAMPSTDESFVSPEAAAMYDTATAVVTMRPH